MILRGTRQLPVVGKDLKLYRKNGGYEQALADFKSLDPDHIQSNNYEMFGRNGNIEIHLRGKRLMTGRGQNVEAFVTLTTKQNLKNSPHRIIKVIEYLSGGSG